MPFGNRADLRPHGLRSGSVYRSNQGKVKDQNGHLPIELELLRDALLELRCIAEEERPDDLHY